MSTSTTETCHTLVSCRGVSNRTDSVSWSHHLRIVGVFMLHICSRHLKEQDCKKQRPLLSPHTTTELHQHKHTYAQNKQHEHRHRHKITTKTRKQTLRDKVKKESERSFLFLVSFLCVCVSTNTQSVPMKDGERCNDKKLRDVTDVSGLFKVIPV